MGWPVLLSSNVRKKVPPPTGVESASDVGRNTEVSLQLQMVAAAIKANIYVL
jgi:hypothetical protein